MSEEDEQYIIRPIADYEIVGRNTFKVLEEIEIPHCLSDRQQIENVCVYYGEENGTFKVIGENRLSS